VIPRYTRPFFRALWSEEAKLRRWLEVELAVLAVLEEDGMAPPGAAARVREKAGALSPQRVEEIEREVRHDVIAFVEAVVELAGEDARFLHFGLTSSDVVDTALSLALKDALTEILGGVAELRNLFWERAQAERDTVVLGRTHGMFAEPMSLGVKFLTYALALRRDELRLRRALEAISYGKLSGAVGTFSQLSPSVEERALRRLGLKPEPVATQVVPRDRHAEVLAALAVLGGNLERFAVEVRLFQRSEVGEWQEPFGQGQKGSSAMPHKQNPVVSERVSGLARLLRAYAGAGFEDIALWHERDISHSSVERVALADATTLADFLIHEVIWLVRGLHLQRERIERSLKGAGGVVFSQKVLLALTERGLPRPQAYEVVQRAALKALEGASFEEALLQDEQVKRRLSREELAALFDLTPYLTHVDDLFRRAEAELRPSRP
jgi:adenylosuccinate lyase